MAAIETHREMPVAIATPEVSVESLGRVFGWAVVHAIAFIAARKWTTPSIFKSRHYDTNYWTSSVISTVHAIIMCVQRLTYDCKG